VVAPGGGASHTRAGSAARTWCLGTALLPSSAGAYPRRRKPAGLIDEVGQAPAARLRGGRSGQFNAAATPSRGDQRLVALVHDADCSRRSRRESVSIVTDNDRCVSPETRPAGVCLRVLGATLLRRGGTKHQVREGGPGLSAGFACGASRLTRSDESGRFAELRDGPWYTRGLMLERGAENHGPWCFGYPPPPPTQTASLGRCARGFSRRSVFAGSSTTWI